MELELLKDIPGYKAILKSVLKTQIQLLIEQLCEQAGEESIILTASISDGTLSHLGSNMGKGFFEGRDEIKSQFLGYCLKNHHNRDGPELRTSFQQDHHSDMYGQGPTIPKRQRFQQGPGRHLHQSSPDYDEPVGQTLPVHSQVRRKSVPKTSSLPAKGLQSSIITTVQDNSTVITDSDAGTTPTVVKVEKISDSTGLEGPVSDSGGDDINMSQSAGIPPSGHLSHIGTSYTQDGDNTQDSNTSGNEQAESSALQSNIKIEPATEEEELDLEITGIEMGASATVLQGDYGQDISGELRYHPGVSGDDLFDQSGNQFNSVLCVADNLDVELENSSDVRVSLNHNSPPWSSAYCSCDMVSPEKDQFVPKKFQCIYCQRKYKNKETLRKHEKKHTKQFVCKMCTQGFDSKECLEKHNDKFHSRRYLCIICGKHLKTKRNFEYHLTTHVETKKFPCPIPDCNKSYNSEAFLSDHMNAHTGLKPYVCNTCKRTYSTVASLSHHKSTCCKDLKCQLCNKNFSSKTALSDHEQSQHGHKHLVCECGKVFKWQTNLIRHKKKECILRD